MTANSGDISAANRVRMGRPGVAGQGRDRFGLAGTSHAYDPRVVAIRPDLADIAVAGVHFAPHYAAPMMMSGVLPAAAMRAAPDAAPSPPGRVPAPTRHDSAVSPGLHRLPARCLGRLTGGLLNGDAAGPAGRLRRLRRGAGRNQQGGKKDRKAAHAPALEDRGAGGNPVRFMLLCGKRVGGFYSLAPRLRETHVSIN